MYDKNGVELVEGDYVSFRPGKMGWREKKVVGVVGEIDKISSIVVVKHGGRIIGVEMKADNLTKATCVTKEEQRALSGAAALFYRLKADMRAPV